MERAKSPSGGVGACGRRGRRLDCPQMSVAYSLYVVEVILGLALLMVVHECGHFFIARAFGMRVTKFSIGFGPTFFKIVPQGTGTSGSRPRRTGSACASGSTIPSGTGPTVYQVAMIPFLAYVQIAGMNPLEDVDEDDKGSYANASLLGPRLRPSSAARSPTTSSRRCSSSSASSSAAARTVRSTEVNVIAGPAGRGGEHEDGRQASSRSTARP